MTYRALTLVALFATVACAGNDGTPSPGVPIASPLVPTPLPQSQWLRPGQYSVTIIGADFRTEPFTQICSPVGVPSGGKTVNTEIELVSDGEWLVGSTRGSDANLEIRLRDAGAPPVFLRGRTAVGEIKGWATDRGSSAPFGPPPTGVTVRVGTVAAISGETFPSLGVALSMLGSAEGTIEFSDAQNRTAVCPSVLLTLGLRTPVQQAADGAR